MQTGAMLERDSSYDVASRKTEEESWPEGKKASRINLERKVGLQGDQWSGKLLQQHNREQEIGQEGVSNFFERPTFLKEP